MQIFKLIIAVVLLVIGLIKISAGLILTVCRRIDQKFDAVIDWFCGL